MGEAENSVQLPVEDPSKRGQEVSAATVARMMGLATGSDIKLLDGKMELLISRIASLTVKIEKTLQTVQKVATTSDIDRVDLQIGNLKSIVQKLLLAISEKRDISEIKETVESAADALDEK